MTFVFSAEKMKALDIAGIFLFGSRAQGVAREDSDYDIGVLLRHPSVLNDARAKTVVYEELYGLLSGQLNAPLNIDIVFLQETDLQLRFHCVKEGKIIYLGDDKIVGDFIERTMTDYADFASHRHQFHQAILDRI